MPAGHTSRPDTEVAGHPTLLSDRYRLDAVLGQGGVGTVWRARDLQLDRDVAVKQLQPGVARDPVAADRFRREATTAASLAHPSLVTIYDVGEDEGAVYLVMELVHGPSVKDVLAASGRLEPGEVAALGHRVAGALVAVHERGLVHRDVKPGNVLLPVDGPPKVVDFGTVHVIGDASATLTTPGTMLGTIGYVAPEQFEGHPIDPRADVYAVGLLLHECLTGEPAFGTGTIAELTRRRLTEDVLPPSRRRPGIPPELDEIIVRATLRDPTQRFADARALAGALAPLVPGDGDGRLLALARQHVTGGSDSHDVPGHDAVEEQEATTVLPRAQGGRPAGADASGPHTDSGRLSPQVVRPAVAQPPPGDGHDATSVLPAAGDAPAPPPAGDAPAGRHRVLLPLAGLAVVAVVATALGLGVLGDGGEAGDGDPGGSAGDTTAVPVAAGQDHDPFGDGSEHADDVPRAFDGDPGTRWDTEGYNSPTLDKPGVGLWVQASEGSSPRRVEVDLAIGGGDVELYALAGPPGNDPAAWGPPVASQADAQGTLAADLPEGTNVVLVWFTSVDDDPEAGRHRGGISEIRLQG